MATKKSVGKGKTRDAARGNNRIIPFSKHRTLAGVSGNDLVSRSQFGVTAGITYDGRRDLFEALGYKRRLTVLDYRARFERNAVAARIVEAKPQATWRGGGVIVEDESPDTETEFEAAYIALDRRLKIWHNFAIADILAGLGYYSVILIGVRGQNRMDQPLTKVSSPDDIIYLQPFSQMDSPVATWDNDAGSERYGRPVLYSLSRHNPTSLSPILTTQTINNNRMSGRPVHFSRIIHIADGMLDDRINGLPRLERCWNLLDDLEKITGGGAEAYWRRADAGLQVDVDPEMEMEPDDEAELDNEIDEYVHDLRRVVRTRGVKMTPLTSPVAGIKDPIEGVMGQISAGTSIPQRILMGSERGQLASDQDDDNWTTRIADRRKDFATVVVVHPTLDRFIELGALPTPKDDYDARWPEIENSDDVQKAQIGKDWAQINKDMGQVVVLPNEIRDRLLGLPPLEDVADPDQLMLPAGETPPAVEPKSTPERIAAKKRKFRTFKRKWGLMTLNQKRSFLRKKFPEKFANEQKGATA